MVVLRRMAMWYTTWPLALLWASHLVKLVQSPVPVTQQTDQLHGFRVCMMSSGTLLLLSIWKTQQRIFYTHPSALFYLLISVQ